MGEKKDGEVEPGWRKGRANDPPFLQPGSSSPRIPACQGPDRSLMGKHTGSLRCSFMVARSNPEAPNLPF